MDPKHNDMPPGGAAAPSSSPVPVWIRLPRNGSLCPWTGLSRSKLFEMLQTKDIETVSLKARKTAKRGARLIKLASLLSYLDKLASAAAGETLKDGEGED